MQKSFQNDQEKQKNINKIKELIMDNKTYLVYISINNVDTLVGHLMSQVKGKHEAAAFGYAQTWLSSPHSFSLTPLWPLGQGMFFMNEDTKFSIFEDCAPDRWGKTLMKKYEREKAQQESRPAKTLTTIDYIMRVNDFARQGALRFKETENGEFLTTNTDNAVPPLVKLPALLHAAEAVMDNADTDNDLALLLDPGSSLGGARPKATVIDDDGDLCIAKFPKKDDTTHVVAWEAVALELAKQCKLNVPKFELKNIIGKDVLIIKRFDRQGKNRIPFASAMTMLGATDNSSRTYNYTEIADFLTQYGVDPNQDLRELWMRILFSVLISNTDDHLRNHGFLHNGKGWALSPVYDVNPNIDRTDMLHTAIAEDNNDATIENALRYAEYFRITNTEATNIANSMITVVKNWQTIAKRYGLPQSEINRMAPAFKV